MKIELKSIKHYESMSEETYCFEASLYVDGERVGAVSNRGSGGCHDYDFDSKIETKLDEWCKANLPKWSMFDDEEYDTDLELHISNLVTEFLDSKHLKKTELLVVLGTSENLLNALLGPVLSVSLVLFPKWLLLKGSSIFL